jgi:hypothetical protein
VAPTGTWTDVFTGTVYHGDRSIALHRTTATIPVLLRQGGILPLTAATELDATRNPTAFEVLVAPSASGEFVLAEDDENGRSLSPEGGPAARTPLRWDHDRGEFRIGPVIGDGEVVPAVREWTITFLALLPSGRTTVDGEPAEVTGTDGRWSVTVRASSEAETVIRVEGGRLRIGPDQADAIRELLEAAQIGNPEKLAAWKVIQSTRPTAERIAELSAVALPEAVRSAMTELLGAVVGADH